MRTASSALLSLAAVLAAGSAFAQPAATPAAAAKPAAPPLRVVTTDGAPKASGPYSQAIVEGGFLFAAGQIPKDPKTGALSTGTIEQAVKGDDFAAMNAVYAKRMGDGRPARTTVFVAGLPAGASIEMDLIARVRK